MMQKRPIEDRYDRFRSVECERPETRPKPSSQEDRLHDREIIAWRAGEQVTIALISVS